jgi:hypothetical protein
LRELTGDAARIAGGEPPFQPDGVLVTGDGISEAFSGHGHGRLPRVLGCRRVFPSRWLKS